MSVKPKSSYSTKVVARNILRHSFTIHKDNIEVVKQYCYLGIFFSFSGSFKDACNTLYDKALKAFYMLKQVQPHHNIKLALKLFDTLVLPIISYGGAIWGPFYAQKANTDNFMSICNNAPLEKLNVRFCKYLLGVHRKSTNDAVRGELGRFPLLISVLNNSHRYFNRIKSLPDHSLVKTSYLDMFFISFLLFVV